MSLLLFLPAPTKSRTPGETYLTRGVLIMPKLNLTPNEEIQLLEVLERYYPELQRETADTDSKEFRKALKEREEFMKDLISRLKR
jgi:hypothetical protein